MCGKMYAAENNAMGWKFDIHIEALFAVAVYRPECGVVITVPSINGHP